MCVFSKCAGLRRQNRLLKIKVTLRSKPSINCTHFGLFGKHIAAVISIFLPCSHLRFTFFCPCVSMCTYLDTVLSVETSATVQPTSCNFNLCHGYQGKSVVRRAWSTFVAERDLNSFFVGVVCHAFVEYHLVSSSCFFLIVLLLLISCGTGSRK